MKKLVIANKGSAQQGKSTSVKEVFNKLSSKYPNNVTIIMNNGDIKAIVEVKGTKVGIESQGDPNSRMPESIDDFLEQECDIIITACRTKGDTYEAVINLQNEGYELIWAPNDRVFYDNQNESLINYLNKKYADSIVQLIEDRISSVI